MLQKLNLIELQTQTPQSFQTLVGLNCGLINSLLKKNDVYKLILIKFQIKFLWHILCYLTYILITI